MAAEVLVGAERRVLISALPPPPPPDSLLGRLDQIDLRLRQLEEERRPSSVAEDDGAGRGAHPAPRHQHSKSMPSALQPQDARDVRGTLMDRLNLLESRIRQLSCELDLDGAGSGKVAASSLPMPMPMPRPAEDCAWSEPPLPEPMRARAAAAAAGGAGASWSAVQILQRGGRQLNRNKPSHPAKVKKLKEAKCACEEEKRKAERAGRPSAGRRWFTVGC